MATSVDPGTRCLLVSGAMKEPPEVVNHLTPCSDRFTSSSIKSRKASFVSVRRIAQDFFPCANNGASVKKGKKVQMDWLDHIKTAVAT